MPSFQSKRYGAALLGSFTKTYAYSWALLILNCSFLLLLSIKRIHALVVLQLFWLVEFCRYLIFFFNCINFQTHSNKIADTNNTGTKEAGEQLAGISVEGENDRYLLLYF